MKTSLLITTLCLLVPCVKAAEQPSPEEQLAKHRDRSTKVADAQDELSADVQQLVIEQTDSKVIALLSEVKKMMNEATDQLAEANTGGETIAAQTEIIEKIHAAAKQKQSKGSGGKPAGAMMDMMERMMGKKPGEGKDGKGKDGKGKGGNQGGKGENGLSDADNDAVNGLSSGKNEQRHVPKASGSANLEIPEEFRKAFDAYNRGAEKKVK